MDLKLVTQLFSLRDLRNAILGISVVIGGIGLSLLTLWAHQSGDARMAGILAGVSLLFVLLILIFVVPPLARNAGREASQMDLPFEFTAGGAIMLGLIVIVGFSAWNTGNNLLFLILSFLAAAMIVGFLAGSICLKKLDVRMRFPETIFAGQETPILVSINNRKRLFASYSVVSEVRGVERERSVVADELARILPRFVADRLSRPPLIRRTLDYFAFVPRNATIEHRAIHIFQNRGRFLIKDFELATRFPFGFVRHRRRLPAREAELYVFPRVEPFDHMLETLEIEAGNITANKRGLGQDLLALRDYQPNDDLRRIDWKATARSRHLTVREFSADDDKRITVFFDPVMPSNDQADFSLREKIEAEQRGTGLPRSSRFEAGVSLAASILARFTEEQAEVRLVIGEDAGEYGIGSRHLHETLRRLAVVEPVYPTTVNSIEPNPLRERILNETDHSFRILVSPDGLVEGHSEQPQQLKIIRF
jgi:uncharacterized protein (DUF58 family)